MSEQVQLPKFIDSLAQLPKSKLRRLEDDELTPVTGTTYIFRGKWLIGGREWVMRFWAPEERTQE